MNEDWIARSIGIITVLILMIRFYYERKRDKIQKENNSVLKKLQINNLLREAKDLIGGEEGSVWVRIQAVCSPVDRKRLELAERKIGDALALDNRNVDTLYHAGLFFLRMGHWNNAFAVLNKAVAIERKFAPALRLMGVVFRMRGKISEAIEKYKEAIKIDPENLLTYINLGNVYCEAESFKEASDSYHKAIAIDHSSSLPYIGLGHIYSTQGDQNKAIEAYQTAVTLDQNDCFPYIGIANCFYYLGKTNDAKRYYHTALKINPYEASAYVGLGNALSKEENLNEATQMYQTATKLAPNESSFYLLYGDILSEQGESKDAIRAYRSAIKVSYAYADMSKALLKEAVKPKASAKKLLEWFSKETKIELINDNQKQAQVQEIIDILNEKGPSKRENLTQLIQELQGIEVDQLLNLSGIKEAMTDYRSREEKRKVQQTRPIRDTGMVKTISYR